MTEEYDTTSKGRSTHVMELVNARRVPSGLCRGSHDYVGWEPVRITHDMVGQTMARFLSVSLSARSYREMSAEQQAWAKDVLRAGGRVLMCWQDSGAPDGVAVCELTRELILSETAGTREARNDWDNAGVMN